MNKLKKLLDAHEITTKQFAKYCGIGERTARRYVNLSVDSVIPLKYMVLASSMICHKKKLNESMDLIEGDINND